jgi:CRISPR-associated exonuclease Cas4
VNQEADEPKFSEDDLLPVSALADVVFCERRAALHHLEAIWADNVFTVEGTFMHQRVHSEEAVESRGDLRIARGLRLRSLRLGLSGIADVVEFHRVPEVAQGPPSGPFAPLRAGSAALTPEVPESRRVPERETGTVRQGTELPGGVPLPGARGLWQPLPVEYKRGRLRREEGYEVQLCAQALCLEEMLCVAVPVGAVFYGQPRKRLEVVFGEELRRQAETAAARLHELIRARNTPPACYEKKCESCSLLTLCMPKTTGGHKSVNRYLAGVMDT